MLVPAFMMMLASPEAQAAPAPEPRKMSKSCRELVFSSTRLAGPVKICKTRAEWRRFDDCHRSVTRYCTPKKKEATLASLGGDSAVPLKGSPLICRDIKVTGTRLQVKRTCLPKREWDRLSEESNATVTEEFSNFSKKPERGCTLSGCI